MARKKGVQVTSYFEAELADKLVKKAEQMEMSMQDLIRLAVRNFISNETLEEVEKLQILNLRSLKFIANKLAHIELISTAMKNDSKKSIPNYDEALNEVKKYNQKIVEEIIEESL